MKKTLKNLFVLFIAAFLFALMTPTVFAEEETRTVYFVTPSGWHSEEDPFHILVDTDDFIDAWDETSYSMKIQPETDYYGNPFSSEKMVICEVEIPKNMTHYYIKGGHRGDGTNALTEDNVYAFLSDGFGVYRMTCEDIEELSFFEKQGYETKIIIEENEKALILANSYYGVESVVVNHGTIVMMDAGNAVENHGTIEDGSYTGIDNYGTINGGTIYEIRNYGGTVNDCECAEDLLYALIYNFSGIVSESVRNKVRVIEPCNVELKLTNLTHDLETFTTVPLESLEINFFATEGYAVTDKIQLTVGDLELGEDDYSYEVSNDSKSAKLYIYPWSLTGDVKITAAGEEAVFTDINNLTIGNTAIVSRSVLKNTSGDGWNYDVDTNILTLENFDSETAACMSGFNGSYAIESSSDLNIVIKGDNRIDIDADNTNMLIYVWDNLTISGGADDSLVLKGGDIAAISADACTISGGTIVGQAADGKFSYGADLYGELRITNNADVTFVSGISCYSYVYGALVRSEVVVDSGKLSCIALEINGEGSSGLYTDKLTVNGGELILEGHNYDLQVRNEKPVIASESSISFNGTGIIKILEVKYRWDEQAREFVCVGHEGELYCCLGFLCENCGEYYGEGDGVSHYGGEANCTYGKICTACGTEYTELESGKHEFDVDRYCKWCKNPCSHENSGSNVDRCPDCWAFIGQEEIKVGQTYEVKREVYVKFVPSATGAYVLSSTTSENDPCVDVYNSKFENIFSEDDSYVNPKNYCDFYAEYEYVKGETYYFKFLDYKGCYDYSVKFECKEHQGSTQTCAGYQCEACGTVYGEAADHSFNSYEVISEPTCSTEGVKQAYCDFDCGTMDEKAVPAKNHKGTLVKLKAKEATCTNTGLTEGEKCSACGTVTAAQKKVAKKSHTYKSVTTKATLSKNGKVESKCSVCGNIKSTTTIYYPKTIKLSKTSYTYNGKEQKPSVIVKDSKDNTLKKDTDYTVKYESGRKSPGKYTVTITFRGKYTGTKKLTYKIAPKVTSKMSASKTTSSITLKWNKVTGADGYAVYKYNTSSKKYVKVKDVTATSVKFSSLSAGTKYKYKVRAYTKDDGTIWGAYSDVFETATKPKTPTLKVTSSKKGVANFSWTNVTGESGYQVYYSTKKDSGYKSAVSYKSNVVSGSKSKLTSGKTYYFKVRAYTKTDSGTVYSSWSTVKSVKVK